MITKKFGIDFAIKQLDRLRAGEQLTFGELYALGNPGGIMEITREYHGKLRKMNPGIFSYSAASKICPEILNQFQPVLDFVRSPEYKRLLRIAADVATVRRTPGYFSPLFIIENRRFTERDQRAAMLELITDWCESNGVRVQVRIMREYTEILAETDQLGGLVLIYKSGMPWKDIEDTCMGLGVDATQLFYWLNGLLPSLSHRINPLVWPVNTPDVYEIASTLVHPTKD
jgi:hypothetical protein